MAEAGSRCASASGRSMAFRRNGRTRLVQCRSNRYGTVGDVARRAKLPKRALIILAEADCFQSQNKDRREMLWDVRRLADDDALPLFASQFVEEQPEEEIAPLPVMPRERTCARRLPDAAAVPARASDEIPARSVPRARAIKSCADVIGDRHAEQSDCKDGDAAACAGIVLTRQMPGDAGVVFITLSDETGSHQCRGLAAPGGTVPARDHGRAAAASWKARSSAASTMSFTLLPSAFSTARRNSTVCRRTTTTHRRSAPRARRGITIHAMCAWCRNHAIFISFSWQFRGTAGSNAAAIVQQPAGRFRPKRRSS